MSYARVLGLRAIVGLAIWLGFSASPVSSQSISANVVISQIYGGGGNQGATLTQDFIELFNRGSSAVNIGNWTVQYASADGSTWDRTVLAGTIEPGQYYLIQETQGNGGTVGLPTPDAVGGLRLSAMSGKIALVDNQELLTGSAPNGPGIIDFVGYGSANAAEGTTAPELDNPFAAIRLNAGCQDTGNNSGDFARELPNPRNSASWRNPCVPITANPVISEAGIVNSASYLRSAVAPGEFLSIFGTDLGPEALIALQLTSDGTHAVKSLGGTRVLFDGIPAPLVFVRSDQLSAIVPFSVAGKPSTTIIVEANGGQSNAVVMPVAPSAPGVFTLNSSGTGASAVLDLSFRVVGPDNPVGPESIILIFGHGAGLTTPLLEDGELVGATLPFADQIVTVDIDGIPAEVLYAGGAPGLVNGVLQVNARVPPNVGSGRVSLRINVGDASSQPGTTIEISGNPPSPGTGSLIEQRLEILRSDPNPSSLAQIPDSFSAVPDGLLALVSWNIQVGGTSTTPGAERPAMVQSALARMFDGTYQLLAAQEIPNSASAQLLRNLLPGGQSRWLEAFTDTTDAQDNGLWFTNQLSAVGARVLFTTMETDANGRRVTDPTRAIHPPATAHLAIGDFDFTLMSVHLTFADGDTAESARELKTVLDYLDEYFRDPMHDPDVIVCGDYNIPSQLSGQTGSGGITVESVVGADPRFQVGERRFVAVVHDPTSRNSAARGGDAVNNYDHCLLSADSLEEFEAASRVDPAVLTNDPLDPEVRLTSDHFPVANFFRTRGHNVVRDL